MTIKTRYIIEGENRTDRLFAELDRDVRAAEAKMLKLKGVALGVGAAVTAAFAFGALALAPTREFEKLEASLQTVTGSSDAAREALSWLEQFAAETPFRLEEVVQAFLTLESRGLKPSAEALRAYGDTAVSLGKSLDQYIEAVADAATGEFERLKEFGIIASTQGKQVQLEFRGMRTTIAKESGDIVEYLQELGQTDFAGGMAKRMDTLDGKAANLGDSFDRLFRTLSEESGLTAGAKSAASAMTLLNNALAESIEKSGVLKGSWEGLIKGLVDSIRGTDTDRLAELLEEAGDIDKRMANLQSSLARTDLLGSERQRLTKSLDELKRLKAEIDGLRVVTETGAPAQVRPSRRSGGAASPLDAEQQKELERQAKADQRRIEQFGRDIDELNREFAREQEEVNQDILRNNEELDRTLRDRQQERLQALEADLRSETDIIDQEYQERLQLLKVAEAKGLQATKDYAELRRLVEEDRLQQLQELREREAKDFEKSQAKMFEDLTRAVEGWGNEAADALVEFATGGKATIGDFVESVLKDLARMLAKKALVDPLFDALTSALPGLGGDGGGSSGGGFLSSVGSFLGGLFGGGDVQGSRATGGPVVAGMPYLWREPGREGEVFVPSTSGTVQDGGGVNVQVVVNNQTASQVNVTRQNAIDSRDGLERLVVDIVDSRLSDGTFDRTMGASYGARRSGVKR